MTVILKEDKGAKFLAKINAIEEYLSELPINYTATIFRDPADGSAFCVIILGTPREVVTTEKLYLSEKTFFTDSDIIAIIRLDMSHLSTFNEGDLYDEKENQEIFLPVLNKISEISGVGLTIQLHQEPASRYSLGVLSEDLPISDDDIYQHGYVLDVFD